MADPAEVIKCFSAYMQSEGHPVSRAQFEQNLHEKARDPAFLSDITPLLAGQIMYDPSTAIDLVRTMLIERLAGERWGRSIGRQ